MTDGETPTRRWRWACLAWALVLVGLHAIPRSGLASLAVDEELVNSRVFDKLAHVGMFGVLGLLAGRGWPGRRWGLLIAVTAFGAALEAFQGLAVAGRSASAVDWACDTLGALAGWFGGRAFRSINRNNRTP